MPDKQVKSKDRVSEHGEVFTAEREVNAMLDLVKQETERIDSRFLEPACGEGAFLTEILRRKLDVVRRQYVKNTFDYERYSIVALTSIYGVDILEDNVVMCRSNLFEIWNREYTKYAKGQANDKCREAARFILSKNIICGDALNMMKNDGTPIDFAEWSLVSDNLIKRRDFNLSELLAGHNKQTTLSMVDWEYDDEVKALIPLPVREYDVKDYTRLMEDD